MHVIVGFTMRVFYADNYIIGQDHVVGDQIAIHLELHCGCYPDSMTDHSHVELWQDGVRIDPTSFLYCNYL